MRNRAILSAAGLVLILASCNKEPPAGQGTQTSAQTPATTGAAAGGTGAASPANAGAPIAEGAVPAEVGKPAPDFTLKDLDGKETKLSAYKGKVVVLEWFNPGCPFVKKSHTKGSLVSTAKKHAKNGVVWLAVNSGAAGKQGAGAEANREGAKTFNMDHPILLDDSGAVGKLYGATNTPHMFVVNAEGTLVYKGAIDNSPDGEGESPTGGKLVSYVDEAITAVNAGKPVATAETKAYGCGVKYK
jgi:peroxiredoxin